MNRIIVSFLSVFLHYLFFRIFIPKSNKLKIGKATFIWNSKIKVSGKNNCLEIGDLAKLIKTEITIKGSNNRIILGDGFKIYEYCKILIEGDNCEIILGNKTTIGSGHLFCGESNSKIIIGENCMLSREVFMNTSDFHSILDSSSLKRINPPQDIFIADHVWIGFNTTISKGAKLGNDSIVASRAVVSGKEYPSNVVLGGIPAKIIKENITWNREKLSY